MVKGKQPMTGMKIGIVGSVIAAAGLSIENLELWKQLGFLGLCAVAVVTLYNDGKKTAVANEKAQAAREIAQEKREAMLRDGITSMTQATQRSADVNATCVTVLQAVKETMQLCHARNGRDGVDGREGKAGHDGADGADGRNR